MGPAAFVVVGSIPLNTNGKIDRTALPIVGVNDNFFDLVGHLFWRAEPVKAEQSEFIAEP